MSTHGRRRLCVRSDAAAGHGKSKIASNPPEAGRVKEEKNFHKGFKRRLNLPMAFRTVR